MHAYLIEETTDTEIETISRPRTYQDTARQHCGGCGEYWPCSDSQRRDIRGELRAQHGPGITPAKQPAKVWEQRAGLLDLLPETVAEIVAAGVRDRELLSEERAYSFKSGDRVLGGVLRGECDKSPEAIAHAYEVVKVCELSVYALADLRAKDPQGMGLLVYEAALLVF